jgi:hypothetical protein
MTVLFFARDPGPANQIVAAYELLVQNEDRNLSAGARDFIAQCRPHLPARIFALGAAIDVWRRAGIEPIKADEASFREAFAQGIAHIVTGTSDVDDDSDRRLWLDARANGATSHAFIDHPANLEIRFRMRDGTPAIPDKIHAPSEAYVPLLVSAGVPKERIDVTGFIHAERLRKKPPTEADKLALRAKWRANPGDYVVLFASECAAEMARAGRPSPYDEFEVLDELTKKISVSGSIHEVKFDAGKTVLIVRPHPRDTAGKYDGWLRAGAGAPRRLISSDGTPEEAISAADLVVGMDSSMLREARALKRMAISLTGADLSL